MYKEIFNQVFGAYAINNITKDDAKVIFENMKNNQQFNTAMTNFIYYNSSANEIGELFKHMVNDTIWSMKNDNKNNN